MWQKARITRIEKAADDILSVVVRPEEWRPHKAGQHYDIRVPGESESRKYSVASSPSLIGELEFGVQLIRNGMLSPRIWGMTVGDEIEIQGPWGESFVWQPGMGGPIVLIGAGSGITPLLSIYAAYKEAFPDGKKVFVMSAKNEDKILHFRALQPELVIRCTEREKRIDRAFLKAAVGELCSPTTFCYVCVPDDFIDSVVDNLLELNFPPAFIRSERFI